MRSRTELIAIVSVRVPGGGFAVLRILFGADHADQLVTRDLFPLAEAITEIRKRFAEHRARATMAAQWFPCA